MAYNNQTFTAGQPITAGMIDYIDDAVDRLDEVVENIMLAVYPVGSIYLSANNVNPATFFGGTWTLVGTKLAISENVFGNGKALALTQGSQWGVLIGADAAYVKNWTGQSIGGGTTVGASFNRNNQALGVPTKANLGSDLSNSGLIVETTTIYSWKRTA